MKPAFSRHGSPSPRQKPNPTPLELRALGALRRAGSLGLLQQFLFPRMRPARPTAMRTTLEQLERLGYIAKAQEPRHAQRAQTVWRITSAGRAFLDGQPELPPAA